MKKLLFLLFGLGILLLLPALVHKPKSISDRLTSNYQKRLSDFYDQLNVSAGLDWNSFDQNQRMMEYKKLRKAYKTVEPSVLYFDPTLITFKINPAPLPKVEPNAPNLSILEPSGIQVLDELIVEDEFDEKTWRYALDKLKNDFSAAYPILKRNIVLPRNAFEQYRRVIITLFTWQVSGYDTPGTHGGVSEARISYLATWEDIELLLSELKFDQTLKRQIIEANKEVLRHLSSDFEKLDRLGLLREGLLPAFRLSVQIQKNSGVEFLDEVESITSNLNPRSEGFFNDDFFTNSYYVDAPMDSLNVLLGKLLFFDPVLSANNQRSCASCHQPEKGFTDGIDKSVAFDFKGKVGRNAPTVLNSTLTESFFHDLRATSMLLQVEHVVISPQEFNTNFKSIANRLSKSKEYKALFDKAFSHVRSDARISKHTVTAALNAYVGSLRSFKSAFDQYVTGATTEYPASAKKGFNLFMGKANCATCHFPPTFSGLVPPLYIESESEVLGVTTKFDTVAPVLDDDMGRGLSGRVKDEAPFRMRSFKTPTLRNIALTGPYMHNGAFETLEEVMHFYNHGGGAGLGLDVPHQTLPEDRLNLTQEEMNNIIAFMKTLTDTVGMTSRPTVLPYFEDSVLNNRKVGGMY